MGLRTHYDNLKVARTATQAEIKAAYRALALQYHPDVNKSEDAERIMKLINTSYEVLSDETRRSAHDRWIRENLGKEPQPSSTRETYTTQDTDLRMPKREAPAQASATSRAARWEQDAAHILTPEERERFFALRRAVFEVLAKAASKTSYKGVETPVRKLQLEGKSAYRATSTMPVVTLTEDGRLEGTINLLDAKRSVSQLRRWADHHGPVIIKVMTPGLKRETEVDLGQISGLGLDCPRERLRKSVEALERFTHSRSATKQEL